MGTYSTTKRHPSGRRPGAPWLCTAALLSLASCSREPPAPAPTSAALAPAELEKVTFQRVRPKVGARSDAEATLVLDVSVTLDGRLVDVVGHSTERLAEEVLELTDGAVSKVRLDFLEASGWASLAGQSAQDEPTLLHGKSYIVESKAGATRVSTPRGKAVAGEEARLVLLHYPSLDNLNALLDALPVEPVPVGTTLPAVARELGRNLAWITTTGMTSTSAVQSVVLMGTKDGNAVLELDVRAALDDGTIRLEVPLRGPLELSLTTGAPVSVRLSGPVTGSSSPRAAKPLPLSAKGKIEVRNTFRSL